MLKPIVAECLSGLPGIAHGFFTRDGGVSTGIYAGLNCGFGSNDDPAAVAENRARVARTLLPELGGTERTCSSLTVLTLHQVHSATAVVVTGDVTRDALPKADGLVTATRGLVIGALAADCGPVLFADAEARVIGVAHSGWKGAVGGILEATIAAMEGLGARRERIRAAVGPCISQANYEVGDAFEAEVLLRHPHAIAFFARLGPSATVHFDLPGFVAAQLARSGVQTVERQSICTYGNESLFFSFRRATHRKEADYGRQISAIVLA
jgi:polyphenol oxidase